MWEKYKKIDDRVIRPLDGFEFCLMSGFLSVTDIFPKFSTENFIKNAEENLPKIEFFNYSIKMINKYPFWIKKSFKINIEIIEWTESEELEPLLEKEEETPVKTIKVFDKDEKDIVGTLKFRICQLKNDKTKLTMYAMHTICDGRTIFEIFDIIRKIITEEKIEPIKVKLCEFNQQNNYENLPSFLFDGIPKTWLEIPKMKILPTITVPTSYINKHYIYDYIPIEKFCKENKLTIQSMLMAMISRTTRKFFNFPKETPLWNSTPFDTRYSPFATKEMKERKFFCGAATFFPCMIGQNSLMEDIKYCMLQLQENKKKFDELAQIIIMGKCVNENNFELSIPEKIPSFSTQPVTSSSHIGRVNGNIPLFNLWYDCGENYTLATYGYHTKEKLFLMTIRPINFDKKFICILKEEMDNIFKL